MMIDHPSSHYRHIFHVLLLHLAQWCHPIVYSRSESNDITHIAFLILQIDLKIIDYTDTLFYHILHK